LCGNKNGLKNAIMNLIFVSPCDEGIYGGYKDAKYLARKHSGCEVICLDKEHSGRNDRIFQKQLAKRSRKGRLDIMAIRRHLILLDFIEDTHIEPPFVMPDWDFMIFQNLVSAFIPFMRYDWATSIHNDGVMMPAHFATNATALRAFYDMTLELIETLSDGDYRDFFNDMFIWKRVKETGKFNVGNTMEIHNGSTFDCGMHLSYSGSFAYKAEPDGYKELTWKDGVPFFETLDDQKVKANWIHCWGKYKTLTSSLRDKSEARFTSP